jgi:hypothetical protein
MDGRSAIFERLAPHMGVCVWGPQDASGVLAAAELAAHLKIGAVSVLAESAPLLASLLPASDLFALTDDSARAERIAALGVTVQLLCDPNNLENIPADAILAFDLKRVLHLDWGGIIRQSARARGLLLVDDPEKDNLHRFYDLLTMIGDNFSGRLQYCPGCADIGRMQAALRLVQKAAPHAAQAFRIFADASFFKNLDFSEKSI